MDLVRQILTSVEERSDGKAQVFEFGGDNRPLREHVSLLINAGYLREVGVTRSSSRTKVQLTWQGHDFLDAVRSQSIWEKTKQAVAEEGGSFSLELLKTVALAFAKKQISEHTGLDF